jgi:hypothetical protein
VSEVFVEGFYGAWAAFFFRMVTQAFFAAALLLALRFCNVAEDTAGRRRRVERFLGRPLSM